MTGGSREAATGQRERCFREDGTWGRSAGVLTRRGNATPAPCRWTSLLIPALLWLSACATTKGHPTPAETPRRSAPAGEAEHASPVPFRPAASPPISPATGENGGFSRTVGDGAARIDTPPRDFWLERTVYTTRWPTRIEAVRVEVAGDEAIFVATVKNQETGERHGIRITPGRPAGRPEAPGMAPEQRIRADSPDGRFVAYAESDGEVRLVVAHKTRRAETVVLQAPNTGDWSIGNVVWAPDGHAVYFDNHGAVACVWRYDPARHQLEKIIPSHSARGPFPFVLDGTEQVAFVDGADNRASRLKVARNLGVQARKAMARGAATLRALPGAWAALTREGDDWVVRNWCGTTAGRLTIDPRAGTMTLGFGQDERTFEVAAAIPTGRGSVSLVRPSSNGAHVEVAEFRYADSRHTLADVTCFACGGDTVPVRFVVADRRDQFRTVGESCD